MRMPLSFGLQRLLAFVLVAVFAVSSVQASVAVDNNDFAADDSRLASVYIQPVETTTTTTTTEPALLATIRYGLTSTSSSTSAEVVSQNTLLYRVGLYDPAKKTWIAGPTVTAGTNLAKTFQPHFVLTATTGSSNIYGVALRGVAFDAGVTRDFAPKASVVTAAAGPVPVLNRPVVLSPEGKKVDAPEEKTFLQKYWWLIGIVVLMMATGGGEK